MKRFMNCGHELGPPYAASCLSAIEYWMLAEVHDWGRRGCCKANSSWVDREMLACGSTTMRSPRFDSNRQIYLASTRQHQAALFEVRLHAARERKRPSHRMWWVFTMSDWLSCSLLAWGLPVTPRDASPTFPYAPWYRQWHLETAC